MASKVILIASCITLSLGAAMVSGREPPPLLGIITWRPGEKRCFSHFNFIPSSTKFSRANPSKVWLFIPGVRLPGLLFRLLNVKRSLKKLGRTTISLIFDPL